jgi:hypothetical protein
MANSTAATASGAIGFRSSETAAPKFWIGFGFAWFALCVYCWGRWVLGPDFVPNTLGRELAPDWYVNLVRGVEIFAVCVTVLILHVFVFRPKWKTGRLSFDGLFFIACWMLYFQEPWINWTSLQFLYSTVFINFGSWCGYIPGWSSPNPEKMPVALVAWGSAYLWLVAIPAYAGSRFMGWVKNRHPDIGAVQLVSVTYLGFVVFDLILESFIVRTQLFNYGATVPELTLFAGTKHQFPIYETISWCGTYTGLACLHFFRDDKGLSFVERGIPRLNIPGRLSTFARFLAIMGYCQLVMLLTYNIPYQFWALHAGPIPQEFELYRTAGVCGEGSDYACPDPGLPIARRSSPTNRIVPLE